MFVRILTAGLCVLLVVGCAKRTAKKPAPSSDETVSAKPQPPNANKTGDKAAKPDEPNWINDPRFKKDGDPALPAETPPNNGKPGWGLPPKGEWTAPPPAGAPPMPGAAPGAPGAMGVLQPEPVKPPAPATPTAPKYNTVTEADMKEVWIFIENFSGANGGKIPSQVLIYKALVAAESKAAPLVKDGSIYLTDTKTRESIWAFETKALTSGGLVCSQNGVETLTAAELKKRLGK
jgi:hypothetical protein